MKEDRVIKIAYIRTQFWFNLKAGGSVGHTLGILSGFKANGSVIKIFSNDFFTGISNYDHCVVKPGMKNPLWLGELLYNLYASNIFKKNLMKFKPDFIYHRYTGYTFFVSRLARKLKIPMVLEFNSFDTWKLKHWEISKNILKRMVKRVILYRIVDRIEKYNLRTAGLISTVSEPLKKDLLKLGYPENKIIVIPNGVNTEKFNPDVSRSKSCDDLRKKMNLNKYEAIIGFSGTFGPWHGVKVLTKAIEKILREMKIKDIGFLIMGDGGILKREMEEQLSGLKDVFFTGTVPYEKIQYHLGVCDILVSPHSLPLDGKEFFGSPTKIFEYMAMGKAIIASDLGQIGRILEKGKDAVLVEPSNAGMLVDSILKMATDRDLRISMGNSARKKAIDNFTWDSNVKKLYSKICETI